MLTLFSSIEMLGNTLPLHNNTFILTTQNLGKFLLVF